MMTGAGYITTPSKRQSSAFRRRFSPFIALFLTLVIATVTFGSAVFTSKSEAKAGPIEWVVCTFYDDSGEDPSTARKLVNMAYDAAFTDAYNYLLYSKSAINSGYSDVTGGLNNLLAMTHDFEKTNEKILGRGIKPTSDYEGDLNRGEKVNPYDRFGMSGLFWSSYAGEWQYWAVDPCNSTNVDMKIGEFYDGRLVPHSTYGDVGNSTDVRSVVAANKNIVLSHDWVNIFANAIFNMTKFTVTIVNALIGIAFSDIVGAIGLEDLISSDSGIFHKLYTGIYLPLILIIMLVMAVWAGFQGIVKRAYRRTFAGIAQSVLMFIIAAIVALQPIFFIALPNNIAVVAQSIIVNAMSSSLYGGDGLCTVGGVYITDKDGKPQKVTPDSDGMVEVPNGGSLQVTDPEESLGLLERSTQSMQSVIGCQIWYQYAFKPWVEGQFGADFNDLWAKDNIDSNFADGKELANNNNEWVGDASVPLGGGYTINNWALFQLSTQTNVHLPLDAEEPELSIYTDGVANDWWRIVDAISNYNEVEQKTAIPDTDANGTRFDSYEDNDIEPVEASIPDVNEEPTKYWEDWIGAHPGHRLSVAFSSLLPAILGNLAPIFFAGMSAILSISIAVAMGFAPVFLLLGSWPGNGWNMFKGWAQLLLNLVMKRIVAGMLLVLSLILISMVMGMFDGFLGFMLIVVVSIALIKFRSQIFEKLSGLMTFSFAQSGLSDSTGSALSKVGRGAKNVLGTGTRYATSLGAGAVIAGKSGDSRFAGMVDALKNEARRDLYRFPKINQLVTEAEATANKNQKNSKVSREEICAYCNRRLYDPTVDVRVFNGGMDQDGNWICEDCMEGRGTNITGVDPMEMGARRVIAQFVDGGGSTRALNVEDAADALPDAASRFDRGNGGAWERVDSTITNISLKDEDGKLIEDPAAYIGHLIANEIRSAQENEARPEVPVILEEHMSPKTRSIVPHMWGDKSSLGMETIVVAYSRAFVNYAYDEADLNVGELSGVEGGSISDDVKAIVSAVVEDLNTKNKNKSSDQEVSPEDRNA